MLAKIRPGHFFTKTLFHFYQNILPNLNAILNNFVFVFQEGNVTVTKHFSRIDNVYNMEAEVSISIGSICLISYSLSC